MKKIFLITLSNLKKTIGNTVSLLILFLISSMLLNAGLLVIINFGSFFEDSKEELNTSNIYYILSSHLYTEEVERLFDDENVIEMHKEDSLWTVATIQYKGVSEERRFLLNDASVERNISKWKFIGEHFQPDDMSIYLPAVFQKDGDYELNDQFTMVIDEETFIFTIKGFTEDVLFSSTESGFYGVYLPHETFEKVASRMDDVYNATLIFANLNKLNMELESSIKDLTGAANALTTGQFENTLFSMDISMVKMGRVMVVNMMSVMIVCFSIIITSVCLIVIRFRIGNTIEDDMTKIGALKALGYTSFQIISSIVLQFILIAFMGCLVGIAMSYLLTPVLSNVFAQQSGLMWVQGFDPYVNSLTLMIILFVVLTVAIFTSFSINKLHPIVALRGGITTHSFRKNHFPLKKSKGGLSITLAFKSIFHNLKQSILTVIILLFVAFAGAFSVVMYYNTNVDAKAFYETPGTELADVIAILRSHEKVSEISSLNGVRKAQFIDNVMVKLDNSELLTYVMDDFSKKETDSIYDGRYPIHSNEVAISGVLSKRIEKGIGDVITLRLNEKEATYLITGLTQGANMGGMNMSMRSDGLLKINPDYQQQALYIYLHDDINEAEFIKTLETNFPNEFISTINLDESMDQGVSVYTSIVSKLGIAILFVSIIVVFLVLYFMINSSIIRKKHELGIQKSIGFTTFQLMNQVSIGFIIPIILGVIGGCALGTFQTNALMTVAQGGMGIMKANYIITPLWIAIYGILLIIVSYLISLILTYRIRKISAYVLVTE